MKKPAFSSWPRSSLVLMLVMMMLGLAITTNCLALDERPLRVSVPHDKFVVREEMVPMRDGVELYTIIITPKKSTQPLPIILQRTPYDASGFLHRKNSSHLDVSIGREYLSDEYIYVSQDIRGRFKSKGSYVMYRPPRGAFNHSDTDETTDAWDTIDWLVGNVPSNGRVGIWGTSYLGWLTLAALRDPHPALAAAVPINPVVDVWKADDWFHWGAFRASYAFDFIYSMETALDGRNRYPYEIQDMYTWLLGEGAAQSGLGQRLDERHEMWQRIIAHPAYGPFWSELAADQWFDKPPRLVPTLHLHGFWDQEDIYGAPAAYASMEQHDTDNSLNYFLAGPWYHGQHLFDDGSRLGDIKFDQATIKRMYEDTLLPFLRRYLHADNSVDLAPVSVFETGTNRWRQFDQWPPAGTRVRLYLHQNGRLDFTPPAGQSPPTEFTSDPSNPVPYAPRPNWSYDYSNAKAFAKWHRWLVEDQRFVDGRPDVVTWISDPLEQPITIRGALTAVLNAETTGTDADWVVKLIDVYPDDSPEFDMSGYQLMVSGDIFRGRYREDLTVAKPIKQNLPLAYSIPLPHANHTILPGHRLMVQVQSSWFPLYDRNPQTFVPSIMSAPDSAYQSQRHRIHHSAKHPTYVEFRVDPDFVEPK